jgi:hypothetical protein
MKHKSKVIYWKQINEFESLCMRRLDGFRVAKSIVDLSRGKLRSENIRACEKYSPMTNDTSRGSSGPGTAAPSFRKSALCHLIGSFWLITCTWETISRHRGLFGRTSSFRLTFVISGCATPSFIHSDGKGFCMSGGVARVAAPR